MNNHVLHSGLVESVPFIGHDVRSLLEQRAGESLVDNPQNNPDISVVIRTFNEVRTLSALVHDINAQHYGGKKS